MNRLVIASAVIHGALLVALTRLPAPQFTFDLAAAAQVELDFTVPILSPRSAAPAPAAVAAPVAAHASAITPAPAREPAHASRLARLAPPSSVSPSATIRDVEAPPSPAVPSSARAPSQPAPATAPAQLPSRVLIAVNDRPFRADEPTIAAVEPRTRVDAAGLFTDARTSVARLDTTGAAVPHDGRGLDLETSARTASQGYFARLIADSNPLEPPHVHTYFGVLARHMRETWRPGFYRTPNMVDALLAAPRQMAAVTERYRNRATTFATTGRPDDPRTPLMSTDFEDRQGFATRTTSSIIEVEQEEDGRVRSIRVVRSARVRDFDTAAVEAVRAAIPLAQTVRIPGGRRSRWAFDVVASRDAFVPIAGFTFNESNGFFEMNYPGALHVRTRIRPIGSRPLDVEWPLPPRPPE